MWTHWVDPETGAVYAKGDYRSEPQPPFGRLVDLDTGQEIARAVAFDEQTGEWEQILVNEKGLIRTNERGLPLNRRGKSRIKFYPNQLCEHERRNDHGDACLDCGAMYIVGEGWQ